MATIVKSYEPTFWDRLYIPALIKGLMVTFRHLFKKKVTVQYPDEKHVPPEGIDLLRCIFCGFCEEACPEEAIELTEIYDFADYTRESFWIDKDGLLEVYDMTKDGNYYLSEKEDAS